MKKRFIPLYEEMKKMVTGFTSHSSSPEPVFTYVSILGAIIHFVLPVLSIFFLDE